MFFSISKHTKQNFPNNLNIHDFCIDTDAGWSVTQMQDCTVVYKGYADDFDLGQNLNLVLQQDSPVYLGNFCVFRITSDRLDIFTDRLRSFPIYVQQGTEVTNLIPLEHTCWTDSYISVNSELEVQEKKFDAIGSVVLNTVTMDSAVQQITDILDAKTQCFLKHNRLPLKVFLSGGVDTTLVYSFLKKHNASLEIEFGEKVEYDYFWLKNSGDIQKNWAYKQIHHYRNPTVLSSGAPGDEFMLRSPTTVDLWLKQHNLDIVSLLADPKWSQCLHSDYFRKPSHLEIFKNQSKCQDNTVWNICNILVNDWQHWHLGNTLTWTPLRDLRILKILLSLPINEALNQIMNSKLSIRIIEQNVPGLSKIISDSKNSKNYLSNLTNLKI